MRVLHLPTYLLLHWLLCFLLAGAHAQVNYQRLVSSPGQGLGGLAAANHPDGGLVVGTLGGQVLRFDPYGNLLTAFDVDSSGLGDVLVDAVGNVYLSCLSSIAEGLDVQMVICLSATGTKLWERVAGGGLFWNGRLAWGPGGALLVLTESLHGGLADTLCYTAFDASGNRLWGRCVTVAGRLPRGTSAAGLPDGWLLAASDSLGAYLIRLDAGGMPVWVRHLPAFYATDLGHFPNGDLFVGGSVDGSNKVVVARLDGEGQVRWARRVSNLVTVIGNAAVTPAGDIVVRTYFGNDMAGLVLLDGTGQLQWSRGYPASNFTTGRPLPTTHGGFALPLRAPGQGLSELIILKTDGAGRVNSCPAFDICPTVESLDLDLHAMPFLASDFHFDSTISRAIFPLDAMVSDYCSPKELPSASFDFPDTLCTGASAEPTNLMNGGAHGVWWDFGPAAIPPTSPLPVPGPVRFTSPGTFELKQVVTFAGCTQSFHRPVVVLPGPPTDLGPDTVVCKATSLLLEAACEPPESCTYLWSDGSTGPRLEVNRNGHFAVTVSDESCESVDSIWVRFFDQTWPDAYVALPADTFRCEDDTLYLDATTPGATAYRWSTGQPSAQIAITSGGNFGVEVFFENCTLRTTVEVHEGDCASKVYVPSAFSPNGDGYNDVFMPYGPEIVFWRLRIFDRWGGMRFDSGDSMLGWDGTSGGEAAPPGTYIWMLEYLLRRDGKIRRLAGEVVLMRN